MPETATIAAVPPRVPPRRNAPPTICAAASVPEIPPSTPAKTFAQPPGSDASIAWPIAAPDSAAIRRSRDDREPCRAEQSGHDTDEEHARSGAETDRNADPVPPAHRSSV